MAALTFDSIEISRYRGLRCVDTHIHTRARAPNPKISCNYGDNQRINETLLTREKWKTMKFSTILHVTKNNCSKKKKIKK